MLVNEQITCFNHSQARRRDRQSRGGFWAAGILALWLVAPAAQCGVLFTNLVSFAGTNGSLPCGGLMQGADGSFYGTTYSGGASNSGVVFRMTNDGTLKVLASFSTSKGIYPQAGLEQGADGNFYGTTSSG